MLNQNLFTFNSADRYQYSLNFQNHEMNNQVLLYHSSQEMLAWMRSWGYRLLGFTKAPYDNGYDMEYALVFEDDAYDIWWIHVGDFNIKEWSGEEDE